MHSNGWLDNSWEPVRRSGAAAQQGVARGGLLRIPLGARVVSWEVGIGRNVRTYMRLRSPWENIDIDIVDGS